VDDAKQSASLTPPVSHQIATPTPIFLDNFLDPEQSDSFGTPPLPGRRAVKAGGGQRLLHDLFPAVEPLPVSEASLAAPHEPQPAEAPTYETFYGLNEPAFDLSADPKFFYYSTSHDQVVQQLLTAVRCREGCVLVTGEAGTGKTAICRVVVDQLDRRTLTSVVLHPCRSIEAVLRTVLADFGVIARQDGAGTPATRAQLTAALASFLGSLTSLEASAVVVIDDAHCLPMGVLADLPSLTDAGPLQLVLVGHPRLAKILKRRELRVLDRQMAVRCGVTPLRPDEILDYVRHRLALAGTNPRVGFDDIAVARIHELTGGFPQLVNRLCARALACGFGDSASVIDCRLVNLAAETLDLEPPPSAARVAGRMLMAGFLLMALMLVGATGALWVFRASVARVMSQWEHAPAAPRAPAPRLPAPPIPVPPPDARLHDAQADRSI
jgi:general secretion pathway protein A